MATVSYDTQVCVITSLKSFMIWIHVNYFQRADVLPVMINKVT